MATYKSYLLIYIVLTHIQTSFCFKNDGSFIYTPKDLTVVEDTKAIFNCQPSETLFSSFSSTPSSSYLSSTPSSNSTSSLLKSPSSPPSPSLSPISIEWFLNDKIIDSRRSKFEILHGKDHSTLILKQSKKKYAGQIVCKIVSSDLGHVLATSPTGYLRILTKNEVPVGFPQTNQQNAAKTFEYAKRLSLSCGSSGKPEPTVQWFKDSLPINSSDPRISTKGGNLQIDNASLLDAGTFECMASTTTGSSFSSPFVVFVKKRTYGPYFSKKPVDQRVLYGGSVSLRCVAVGSPMPKVEWSMANGKKLEKTVMGEGNYVLNISAVIRSIELTCTGSSNLGHVSHEVKVTVVESQGISHDNDGDKELKSIDRNPLLSSNNQLNSLSDNSGIANSAFNLNHDSNSDSFSKTPTHSKKKSFSNFNIAYILSQNPNIHKPYTPLPKISPLTDKIVLVTLSSPPSSSSFNDDLHKDWRYYLVVVPESLYDLKLPSSLNLHKLIKAASSANQAWACGMFNPTQLPVEFVVGDGRKDGTELSNGKLDLKGNSYKLFIRLVTSQGQEYSSEYSEMVGKMNYEVDEWKSGELKLDGLRSKPLLLIVLPLCLAIGLVLLIIFIISVIRHKNKFTKKKMAHTSIRLLEQNELLMNDSRYSPASNNAESFYSGSSNSNLKVTLPNNTLPTSVEPLPILLSELQDRIGRLMSNDGDLLHKEYETIDPGRHFTWKASREEVNSCKNRYANVVAYDHSRVVLRAMEVDSVGNGFNNGFKENGNDYINANLINGMNNKQYIATQGPLQETFGDFWKMVWQSGSGLIVMVSKLEERNRVKCDQYWPTEGVQLHAGCLRVHLKEQLQLAFYTVRTFNLTLTPSQETREVYQLQFTAWPDHGVPTHPTQLIHFINRIACAYRMNTPSPIIVHCSAGVGRTGCVIAIDILIDQLQQNNSKSNSIYNKNSIYATPNNPTNFTSLNLLTTHTYNSPSPTNISLLNFSGNNNTVDVFTCVSNLRSYRNYMVQSEDQYLLIHQALMEVTLSPHATEVPAAQLPMHFCRLQQQQAMGYEDGWDGSGKRMNKIELEFQRLGTISFCPSSSSTATLPCNNCKNKDPAILPLDLNRVVLQAVRGVDGSDYINASFIDGYRHKKTYIATQSPTPDTTNDFWRMVWEKESTVIVMLDYQEKFEAYWPLDKSRRFNCYVLDPFPTQNFGCYVLRKFRMTDARDGQSRLISQFQLVDWSLEGGSFGVTASQFSSLIVRVEATREACQPIIVHCCKGAGRTGVFIGACSVVERATVEGVVDVYETVKLLRTQRAGLVTTIAEYSFLYEAVIEYLKGFSVK